MKKNYLLILILCALISSCGYKFSLQKRRYNNGFFITSTSGKNSFEKSHTTSHNKKIQAPIAKTDVEIAKTLTPLTKKSNDATDQNFIKHNGINTQLNNSIRTQSSLLPVNVESKKSRINNELTIKNKNKLGDILEIFENIYIAYLFITAIVVIAILLLYLFSVFPPLQAILIIIVGIIILALMAGLGAAIRY